MGDLGDKLLEVCKAHFAQRLWAFFRVLTSSTLQVLTSSLDLSHQLPYVNLIPRNAWRSLHLTCHSVMTQSIDFMSFQIISCDLYSDEKPEANME